jgi:rhodanese-related sulfurtransferase
VDLYRYDEAWELSPSTALSNLYAAIVGPVQCLSDWVIIDLRNTEDFEAGHLPDALNLPLQSLAAGNSSPFFDSRVLEEQWRELESLFGTANMDFSSYLKEVESSNCSVMLICYGGDTSRVATSVFRARNIQASSISGGMLGYDFGSLLVPSVNKSALEQQQIQPQQISVTNANASTVNKSNTAVIDHRGALTVIV